MNKAAIGCMVLACSSLANAQLRGWSPTNPGRVSSSMSGNELSLKNRVLWVKFDPSKNSLHVESPWARTPLEVDSAFGLQIAGAALKPTLSGKVTVSDSAGPTQILANFVFPGTDVTAKLSITMANGAHYAREALVLQAGSSDAKIDRVYFGQGKALDPKVGTVQGSPITAQNFFLGLEHPMSDAEIKAGGNWSLSMARKLPLIAGKSISYSAVIGVAPEGQMRRAFLSYLEDQRPRRYEPFLHYNSWYDLGYFNRYTADQCVDRINRFGDELAKKRGVKLRSFLFDDGWDDPKTVWEFHGGFPNKFTPLKQAADKFSAGPGVWLSPWGGYGGPRDERLIAGKAAGMEIDSEGYALSGPKYYELFRKKCLEFVKDYGVNQFKFDGTGSPDKQYPGSAFSSDFEAAIELIHDLREAKPGLFINLTTGTWPSPFWTQYADSIWRGGNDHSFDGVGPWREKWMTYRDGDTFHNIVSAHSMYPLNSLMLHGMIFAKYANHLSDDPSNDFRNEIRSYFGNGTQLQEMYITPDLLSTQNWDDLAESAKWSYANRDVLIDSHWVGGDPSRLGVYGWASWSPRKSILVLRNPNDKPQAFSVDLNKVLELPASVHGTWNAASPYKDSHDALEIQTGASKVVVLKPFQVMVLEGAIR